MPNFDMHSQKSCHKIQIGFFFQCLQSGVFHSGWRQEFSDGGADSSDEGAKIRFLGYYKCQKAPKKSCFTF